MSTHPNAILMAVLKPDDTSRKTARALLAEYGPGAAYGYLHIPRHGEYGEHEDRLILHDDYHILIMESTFDESYQITADEGDIVIFRFVTYGYGESIPWTNLEKQAKALDAWCKSNADRHKFSYEIRVSANYW